MYNFFISLVLWILIIMPQVISWAIFFILPNFTSKSNILLFILIFLITFFRKNISVFVLIFFALLETVQFVHIYYFGTFLQPELLRKSVLMISEDGKDIFEVLKSGNLFFLVAIFSVAISYGLSIYLIKRFDYKLKKSKIAEFLFISFFVIIFSLSQFIAKSYLIYPNSKHPSLINSITAFISSFKKTNLSLPQNYQENQVFTIEKSDALKVNNVIFIIGESCRYDYMSLFGYKNKTTPNLENLKKKKLLKAKSGYSYSVSTMASITGLLNGLYHPAEFTLNHSKLPNLIILAKQNGYKVHIISMQSSQLFHSAQTEYADSFLAIENFSSNEFALNRDHLLIKELQNIELSDKNFIILHQRNLHSMYDSNFNHREEVKNHNFSIKTKNIDYERAMFYQDIFFKDLVESAQEKFKDKDAVMLYTSDHGELLGEKGLYGHNHLILENAKVPMIIFNINNSSKILNYFQKNYKFVSHYDWHNFTTKLLGFKVTHNYFEPDIRYLMSSDFKNDTRYKKYNLKGKIIKKTKEVE